MIFIFEKLSFGLLIWEKGKNRLIMAQKFVPNLEINRYVTFALIISCSLTSNNKRMVNISFKNSDPHIYFDPLFLKSKNVH